VAVLAVVAVVAQILRQLVARAAQVVALRVQQGQMASLAPEVAASAEEVARRRLVARAAMDLLRLPLALLAP
jgi:hypothetical protein